MKINLMKTLTTCSLALGLLGVSGITTVASANSNNNQPTSQTVQMQNVRITHAHHSKKDIGFHHVMKIAKSKLGDRYVWGGNGPTRFDCSGFTKYIYRKGLGINLPRLAGTQYYANKKITHHHRQAGDLVFFGSSKHSITHVGMYIGHGKMIDAQNRGVIIENVKAPWWHAVGYSRPTAKFSK